MLTEVKRIVNSNEKRKNVLKQCKEIFAFVSCVIINSCEACRCSPTRRAGNRQPITRNCHSLAGFPFPLTFNRTDFTFTDFLYLCCLQNSSPLYSVLSERVSHSYIFRPVIVIHPFCSFSLNIILITPSKTSFPSLSDLTAIRLSKTDRTLLCAFVTLCVNKNQIRVFRQPCDIRGARGIFRIRIEIEPTIRVETGQPNLTSESNP